MATTLPVDSNVKVPAAVLAAAQRATELLEAQNAPPAEENQDAQAQGGQQDVPPEPAPEPEPAQEQAPAFAEGGKPEGATDENDQSWKQKFESVNGRYTRSQADLRAATRQIAQLQEQLDRVMIRLDELQAAPQSAPQFDRLVTEEEEKDYGSDLLKVVAKKAREELAPELSARDREIEDLKKRLETVVSRAETATKETMYSELGKAVPNWEEVNRDQNFLEWLEGVDIYSGQQRKSMLIKAYNAFDAARVAAFFQGFLQEAAVVAPQSAQPGPAPQPNKIPLEQLAAPGRPKAAAPQTGPADKPVITRQYIDKFYADSVKGAYRGREAEYRRIEAEIFEAQRDGRVQ